MIRRILVITIFGIIFSSCTEQKERDQRIENLQAFARVYGYVKYFHPSDEAAKTNWERLAVYGAKKVENAKDENELKIILNEIFRPIAPSIIIHHKEDKKEFDLVKIVPEDTTGFKHIAWQHRGLNTGSSIYKSVRTNRKVERKPNYNTWGSLVKRFDATPYRGMEFKLEAYVKANVKSGKGAMHLWLRVDRKNNEMGFFENMNGTPIESNEWQNYSFSGQIDNDAAFINIGTYMTGAGEGWIDDYVLKVKDGGQWKSIATEGFENYDATAMPDGWEVGIGKGKSGQSGIYSFAVASDEVYSGAKSLKVKASMETTFSPPEKLFEEYPKPGEYISRSIGRDLKCILPVSLFGTEDYTYPKGDTKRYDDLVAAMHEETPEDLSGNDHYVRLGNLIITWNIFQHFYPYFDVVNTDWNAALANAIKDCYDDKSDVDFLQTLKAFTAHLKDGHIWVNLIGDASAAYTAPFEWEWIADELVIINSFNTAQNIEKGDIVLEVDSLSPKAYFDDVKRYISAATDGWMNYRAAQNSLQGEKGSAIALKLKAADGTIKNVSVERSLKLSEYRQQLLRNKKAKFKALKQDLYYLNLDLISMTEIDSLMPELSEASGIICDLRGYPNGNHDLIAHFLSEKDTSANWMQVPKIIYPDYENLAGYEYYSWGIEPKAPHLNSKVVFIIDGSAISYAESYMSFIAHYNLAIIVGQPTAGTNGNTNPFTLPGGYRVSWTGMKVMKHDGSQHHGVGILPDVYVDKTINGVLEDRDEYLEKAIELIESKQ